jgi:hypothetical protein
VLGLVLRCPTSDAANGLRERHQAAGKMSSMSQKPGHQPGHQPPSEPDSTTAPVMPSERALQARYLKGQKLSARAIGERLDPPCKERQVRRLLAQAPEPAVEDAPDRPQPAQALRDGETGQYAAPPPEPETPPGEVLDILLMGAGPVVNGRSFPRSVMRRREPTREELGEKLVGSTVGSEARLPGDGMQAVSAYYREMDERRERQRVIDEAPDGARFAVHVLPDGTHEEIEL